MAIPNETIVENFQGMYYPLISNNFIQKGLRMLPKEESNMS
jgi:hypothetical protein